MAYRSSGITRNMWQLFRTLDSKKQNPLSIEIRNRMSASVFFDCLNLLRDQVGITKLSMKTDQSITAEVGEHDDDDEEDDGEEEEEEDDDDNVIDEQVIDESPPENEKGNSSNGGDDAESSNMSLKTTPGSTYSSKVRKARSLSNNADAESKARRIIRTIPLDPEPISIGSSKRSSIFKVVNSSADSSPREASTGSMGSIIAAPIGDKSSLSTIHPMTAPPASQLQEMQLQKLSHGVGKEQAVQRVSARPIVNHNAADTYIQQQQQPNVIFNDSPIQIGLENLDMENLDNDVLWKDVGDLMNDFGFHAF